MTTAPLTEQQLDEITARAAAMFAHADLGNDEDQREAERLSGQDVPDLVAEIRRQRTELAPDRAEAIAWAADVIDAKLTAEPDHTRASALYELLLHLRGELPCTCARSGGLHEKSCRKYVPGHELISRHNQLAIYRVAHPIPAMAAHSTPAPPAAPLDASHSPAGDRDGATGTEGAAGREGDSGGAIADRLEAVLTERFTALGNPYSRMSINFQGPDGWPASKEVGPHDVAEVLRELLATPPRRTLTPNEYDAAWHAVEGAAGEEGADPGTVLHAVLNRLGIEWQDAARPTA
jgi:hypothetical protein